MNYETKEGILDLSKLTRLYPASIVEFNGETAEMSLEWTEMNEDKVNVLRYVLIFDFTPQGDDTKIKKTLTFQTRDELIDELQKVSRLFS